MKLLMIGGTRFSGRTMVQCALEAGDDVTVFHRGQSGIGDFAGKVKEVIGNRDGELDKLPDEKWDAVIDTCGFVPRVMRQAAEQLKDRVGWYTFISTISVYSDENQWPTDEVGNVIRFDKDPGEEITPETYGGLKALCEDVVREQFPENHTIVRPGLIVGPDDYSDRFTYWPARFLQGGEVLVPNCPDRWAQFIDARDLGRFTYKLTQDRKLGTFLGNGPDYELTFRQLFDALMKIAPEGTKPVWVDEQFIMDQGGQPWMELPLWLGPEEVPNQMRIDPSKAVKAGLEFTAVETTCRDTAEWHKNRGQVEMKAGLPREKEKAILEAWKALSH